MYRNMQQVNMSISGLLEMKDKQIVNDDIEREKKKTLFYVDILYHALLKTREKKPYETSSS